jgi:hypothetical protein
MEGFKGELEQAGVPDLQKLVSPIIPPSHVDPRLLWIGDLYTRSVLSCRSTGVRG